MQAINRPFSGIINGSTQFVIPVFQRDYRWEEPQCRQLWYDIKRAAAANGHGHFIGSVVYIATGDTFAGFTRWLLIDGQQRLTTLTLLLAALRNHIKATNWRGGEDAPTAAKIDAYFLQNAQEEGQRRQKLVLRRRDDETLAAIISGGDMPAEPSDRVLEAYELFQELIAKSDPSEIYAGINKLVVVDVSLDRLHDDPQLVFESLNSTGVDLSPSDLIRNFILMKLPEADQTRLYNTYWSKIETLFRGSESVFDDFIRDYIALKKRATKQQKSSTIYSAFREIWDELLVSLRSFDDVLEDLLRYGSYYAAFSLGRGVDGNVLEALRSLHGLVEVPAITIMKLFDCFKVRQTLDEQQFIDVIRLIESYVMRRAVCQEQTRGYWQVFADLAYNIDPDKPMDSLKVGLASLREAYRFIDDDAFNAALTSNDIYALRGICRKLLEQLENANSKEPSQLDKCSIEHVMPQNKNLAREWRNMLGPDWQEVQNTWVHRLGNLTLTAYNSELSDLPFEKKKELPNGFSDSAVRLNKFVREQAQWTSAEIEARGKSLAAKCLTIWPSLSVPPQLLLGARAEVLRRKASTLAISQISMTETVHPIFKRLQESITALGSDIIEVPHKASVSYHTPEFLVEAIPRARRITLILPIDFAAIDDPPDIAGDATDWKFFVNAQYSGGTYISLRSLDDVATALPILAKVYSALHVQGEILPVQA